MASTSPSNVTSNVLHGDIIFVVVVGYNLEAGYEKVMLQSNGSVKVRPSDCVQVRWKIWTSSSARPRPIINLIF